MKNVLGIIASTRKMGNSELAAKMISRYLPQAHRLHLIRLADLIIKSCLGCYYCMSREGECSQDDDMEILLDALREADGVILAVPVYFFGPHANLKVVVDRSAMLYPRFERFVGKPCVIAMTLGVRGKDGYTLAALGSGAMTMGLDIMGTGSFLAGGPGEILCSEENHLLATELGRKLFSSKSEFPQDGRRCQICGSQSFKFIEHGVECLVCQSRGELISKDVSTCLQIKESSDSEVMTLEDRRHHLEWVRGEKKRYKEKREDIRKLSREFIDYGIWIKGNRRAHRLKESS
jgi:multimeric flavodoxin WrbA